MKNNSITPIAVAIICSALIFKDHIEAAVTIAVLYAVYRIFIKDPVD